MKIAYFSLLLSSTSQMEPLLLFGKSQAFLSYAVSEFGLSQARVLALPLLF